MASTKASSAVLMSIYFSILLVSKTQFDRGATVSDANESKLLKNLKSLFDNLCFLIKDTTSLVVILPLFVMLYIPRGTFCSIKSIVYFAKSARCDSEFLASNSVS